MRVLDEPGWKQEEDEEEEGGAACADSRPIPLKTLHSFMHKTLTTFKNFHTGSRLFPIIRHFLTGCRVLM